MRRVKSILSSLYVRINEKTFGDDKIKYIYQKTPESDVLLVIFAGFSSNGAPAKYNYIRTLKKIKMNKLFVLDDSGYNGRGTYYLKNRDGGALQKSMCALIRYYKKDCRLITVGSSKGGTAALYYGLKCGTDECIIGAPQYHIGDYLNTDEHRKILEGICGDCSIESVNYLNSVLKDEILSSMSRPLIYLHCSKNDNTYKKHVVDLVKDLQDNGYEVYGDFEYDYRNHSELARYFPPFLINVLKNTL